MGLDIGIFLTYVGAILLIFIFGRIFVWPMKVVLKLALNSLIGGAAILLVNALGAYTLSRKDYAPNRFFVYYLVIVPMLFSGGTIPTFLLMKEMNLLNTLAVCIIPGLASGWNMVLIRNYYNSIPQSLTEAATIDGASEFYIFGKIILPLSKPVLAAIALFTGVGCWNIFTPAIMYNSDPTKITFAVKLREMIAVQEDMSRQFEQMMHSLGMNSANSNLTTEDRVHYSNYFSISFPAEAFCGWNNGRICQGIIWFQYSGSMHRCMR